MEITVILNPEQEKFFKALKYSISAELGEDGEVSDSHVINHVLMEVLLFEELTDDQITGYLQSEYEAKYNAILRNRKRDFGVEFKPITMGLEQLGDTVKTLRFKYSAYKGSDTRDEDYIMLLNLGNYLWEGFSITDILTRFPNLWEDIHRISIQIKNWENASKSRKS